jgi:hypothetical protein
MTGERPVVWENAIGEDDGADKMPGARNLRANFLRVHPRGVAPTETRGLPFEAPRVNTFRNRIHRWFAMSAIALTRGCLRAAFAKTSAPHRPSPGEALA